MIRAMTETSHDSSRRTPIATPVATPIAAPIATPVDKFLAEAQPEQIPVPT